MNGYPPLGVAPLPEAITPMAAELLEGLKRGTKTREALMQAYFRSLFPEEHIMRYEGLPEKTDYADYFDKLMAYKKTAQEGEERLANLNLELAKIYMSGGLKKELEKTRREKERVKAGKEKVDTGLLKKLVGDRQREIWKVEDAERGFKAGQRKGIFARVGNSLIKIESEKEAKNALRELRKSQIIDLLTLSDATGNDYSLQIEDLLRKFAPSVGDTLLRSLGIGEGTPYPYPQETSPLWLPPPERPTIEDIWGH